MHRFVKGVAAVCALIGVCTAAEARQLVPAEKRFWSYDGTLPTCSNADVLDRLSTRFGQTEHEYWASDLQIVGYDHVSAVALRPWGLDHIPRNFCRARATFNDRTVRTVAYAVIEGGGIIGMDFGVEWCVVGLERNYAYAPDCKMESP